MKSKPVCVPVRLSVIHSIICSTQKPGAFTRFCSLCVERDLIGYHPTDDGGPPTNTGYTTPCNSPLPGTTSKYRSRIADHRAELAVTHDAMIDLGDIDHLHARAAEESRVGHVKFRAADRTFDRLQAQFSARQLDDDVARDAFQNVLVHRRRDQLAVAQDENVLGAAFATCPRSLITSASS